MNLIFQIFILLMLYINCNLYKKILILYYININLYYININK